MKIAIQLAGYLRRYEELYQNFNDKVIQFNKNNNHQVDVFISTYDELDSVNSFSYKEGQNNAENTKYNISDVCEKYDVKCWSINNFDLIKPQFNIREYFPDFDINLLQPNLHNNGIMFGLSMHYNRYHCNLHRKRYEKENNIKYDIVFIGRFDLFWLDNLDFSKLNPEKLSAREKYYDYFFVSKPQNIDNICDVWLNIKKIGEKYGNNPHKGFGAFSPEYFLENHLLDLGITDKDRDSISEGSCVLYPRKNFWPVLDFVLNKHYPNNKLEKIQEISKYNLTNYG